MTEAEEELANRPDAPWDAGTMLPHLGSPAAAVRQIIAGHALAGIRHVVEIGGAGLPITGFLRHVPQSVTVIDPKIVAWQSAILDNEPCDVRHLSRKFIDADADATRPGTGVVLLGLSLKPHGRRPAISEALIKLCAAAERVVIEHSLALERAVAQLPDLLLQAGLVELWSVDLVLRDGILEGAGHHQRRLMVLKPGRPQVGGCRSTQRVRG
jgi:hypothetical protein